MEWKINPFHAQGSLAPILDDAMSYDMAEIYAEYVGYSQRFFKEKSVN